jgi:predicted ATPase/DNA-binding XRE family transcriptional regulator
MKSGVPPSFGTQLKTLREAAGFTQEELATIAGLSVHAVSALERGERRRPHVDTVRALSAALDLTGEAREALVGSARAAAPRAGVGLRDVSVPLPLTTLLGRDGEMRTLRQWLADPGVRLVTLTGPGGAGKTRLALELAREKAADGVSRVLFVALAATRSTASVAAAVAEALSVLDATPLDLPRRVRAACDGTPTMLVLDNFEQVLDATPLIADLLASVTALRVLVTSRAPLRVGGEREYAVGPLELTADVDAASPADLARTPAIRLFIERVRDVQPGFRLTSANGSVITAICRRLDSLPLALELAAPWLKVLTADDLLRRLTRDVLLSSVGPRDLPERQQTINATVAWSYQLLGPGEQRVFRRLGALPGRFSIDAAAVVLGSRTGSMASGEALGAVAGLIDRSLVLRADTSIAARPLYQMLETVRAYAALELGAAGERDEVMEAVARYCLREASLAVEGMAGPAQIEWLDRVHDELDCYRGALAWLIERARAAEASAIASGLMAFWLMRGHLSEGLQWYQQTLQLPSLSPADESRALLGAAVMSYSRGELERAEALATRAVAVARRADDHAVVLIADNLLGHVDHAVGRLESARDRFTRTIEMFRQLAISWGTGNALGGMAGVVLTTGDVDRAERLLVEATAALQHTGPWFLTPVMNLRAIAAVRRGSPDEAIALVRENLTRIRELQDAFAFVYALVALAAAAALKGDDMWAARILGAGDAVTDRTGAAVVDTSVQEIREQTAQQVRARLGLDRWGRANAAGRVTSIDSLIKDIDAVLAIRRRA